MSTDLATGVPLAPDAAEPLEQAVVTLLHNVRRHAADSIGDLAAKGELTASKAEAAGDTAELRESISRLHVSLAQLNVLRAALEEAENRAGWLMLLLRLA